MQKSVNSINIDYQQNQSIYLPIKLALVLTLLVVNTGNCGPVKRLSIKTNILHTCTGFQASSSHFIWVTVYSILPVAFLCGCWFMKPVSVPSNHYIRVSVTITTVICIMLTHGTYGYYTSLTLNSNL